MTTKTSASYWKRLWRWITSESLTDDELLKVLGNKDVLEELRSGISSYKPGKSGNFAQLQASQPDQTKLLSVVQTLQQYMEIDCFQIWDILKNYLCDISYGTPANALKNIAFVDTRPSFLLPNIWKFYYSERLFLLKLLQYIIENKDNTKHKYNEVFKKIVTDIGVKKLKTSLIDQFESLLSSMPPPRKIQNDFSCNTVRQEWAEANLHEKLTVLQNLLLISTETPLDVDEFKKLFGLFQKHGFGKKQTFHDLLDERHRDLCMRIMYMEVCFFMCVNDKKNIADVSSWIESSKQIVESHLTQLHVDEEQSAMLVTWMMLTLQSPQHAKLFESQYQQFGATALRMRVFEFLQQLINSTVFSDNSKCALIARQRIFTLLNELCDKFDSDGTLSLQPGIMELCSQLLSTEEIADQFWKLHAKDEEYGVVSLWNTALEYFPYNFGALSVLAAGLSQGGKCSVCCLLAELKNLPVYTEIFNPNTVNIVSLISDDAVIGRDCYPLGDESYHVEAGSRASIMERDNLTLIHYRTPVSYWTVLNSEIEKSLDRKGHHQHNIKDTLQRVYEGSNVLKHVLKCLTQSKEVPRYLVTPSEGIFDVLIRFMRTDAPLATLVSCLEICTALIPAYPNEIHMRLTNTGLLPRLYNTHLTPADYANGASFDSAAVGAYLVDMEQSVGKYDFLGTYIDMLCAFHETIQDDRVSSDVLLPGLVLILREVFPNISSWRYVNTVERRKLLRRCITFLSLVLQNSEKSEAKLLVKRTCIYSLLHTENVLELLNILCAGNDQLEKMMQEETNWISGTGCQYINTVQRTVAIIMLVLKLKTQVTDSKEVTPLEQLIFAHNTANEHPKVLPKVTSYINHAFNNDFAVLCCKLLKKFAEGFQMSLFASLDMTGYQVRVMFLDRLRDDYETPELKIAILEFVATCVGKQPGLTEAFFKLNHVKPKIEDEKDKDGDKKVQVKKEIEDGSESILGYLADYLATVKNDAKLLHSPLLACMMALFHALWKNNMQVLVKELRENPKFWEHMTSPLFSDIQPGLRTYSQIFNVLGIELFLSRDKIEPNLKEMLEQLFDTNKKHLDNWINYVFSFNGRSEDKIEDSVPSWLGLLTSWKDFTTVFCKCLPFNLSIAHKTKMAAPCLSALLQELENLKDIRLVVILSELYVIMLANWKEDCFDNRTSSAKQIDQLLTNAGTVYDSLHPRAQRAILSIGTVAISCLDYQIKANMVIAQNVIRSVTNINSFELEKLFDEIKDPKENGENEDMPPVVLSLAMLEQCLDLYDDMFSGLALWFQSSRFTNKLLCCLQACLQNRRHYQTSLAALRCLTAYSRGAFSRDLLLSDVDQFLWLQLLPPKFENGWKAHEWWRVYEYSLDFISMMVMKHGQFFAGEAIKFVGVHLEHLVEAILLPRQVTSLGSLNLCAAALNLVVQLVQYESRWRIENINSLYDIMRSICACLYQCVTQMLRLRRSSEPNVLQTADESLQQTTSIMHRTLEIFHMSTLCLLSFSPDVLSLLADPALDMERWQPLVEIHFGAPKPTYDQNPQLTFGTLLAAVCVLTKSLNHAYHTEEAGSCGTTATGGRSPRRRRACSCGSPGEALRTRRSESLTSLSSCASAAAALPDRLLSAALHAAAHLLAAQALLAVRDPSVPARHKQLIRRELGSELTVYHDFVRKRILCAVHARSELARNKLGAKPLDINEEEAKLLIEAQRRRNPMETDELPPPPPPKRPAQDSMREYILRKHYLDKCSQTPTKDPPSPVSHSTPTSDKKKEVSRSSKRVSWAETTQDSGEDTDTSLQEIEPAYSNLTEVNMNNDDDYFHLMSVIFLFICQTEM